MSEYIFSMDKPKDCYDCKLIKENDEKNGFYDCVLTGKACALGHVSIYCPLIEVPTPHGDLVDRQKLIKALSKAWDVDDDSDFANKSVWRIIEKETPTIIGASKERE